MAIPSLIKEIDLLKKELAALLPMSDEQQQKLYKKFRLEFHYNSNHIEGNTLTYGETELLLIFDETRGNHTLREYEEMKASDVALQLVEKEATEKEHPLTESFIKNLNKVLLVRPYFKEAITPDGQPTRRKILIGDYKKHPNSVRLQNGEIFSYAPPAETPIQMGELIAWYKAALENDTLHPVELAAQLHYKFVRIHPFDDGNGRISRLLMNYVLLHFGYPLMVIKSDDKKNYLAALHDADTGNLESFENYIAEQLIWPLQLSIKAARNENIEEDEDWKKKISLLNKELDNVEPIEAKKSSASLELTINNCIIPFLKKIDHDLGDIRKLFLETYVKYDFRNDTIFDFGEKILSEQIDYFISNNLRVSFSFNHFKKNGLGIFDLSLNAEFRFTPFYYGVFINGSEKLHKFYNKQFSEAEVKQIGNECGKYLLSAINRNIKFDDSVE